MSKPRFNYSCHSDGYDQLLFIDCPLPKSTLKCKLDWNEEDRYRLWVCSDIEIEMDKNKIRSLEIDG